MSKLSFVVSLITQESDYQREQADAAQQVARRVDVDLQILYADNDAIKQSQQLFEVIQNPSSSVNALILEPAGSTAFPRVAHAAVTGGLGWVVMNRDDASIAELRSQSSHPIFAVSADQEETGRILGRQIAILLPRGGTVLCVQGPSGNPVSEQRMVGMGQTKPENIKLKLLRSPYWTEAGGFQAVSSWLRLSVSHDEDVAGVIGQSDLIALGAHRAFHEHTTGAARDRWLSLPFLGVNGLKVGQNALRSGVLASTVVVPPTTVPAIEMLVRAYRDGVRPSERTLVAPRSFPDLGSLAPRGPES
jgi:ABC-type sugar transport system substrate-binding protein